MILCAKFLANSVAHEIPDDYKYENGESSDIADNSLTDRGTVYGLDRGLVLRFLFYALIAFCVLLLRTRRLEKNRRLSRRWCAIAFVVVVPVSVGMLYVFMMKFNE